MRAPGLRFGDCAACPFGQPLQVVKPFMQVLAGAAGHSDPLHHIPCGRVKQLSLASGGDSGGNTE